MVNNKCLLILNDHYVLLKEALKHLLYRLISLNEEAYDDCLLFSVILTIINGAWRHTK